MGSNARNYTNVTLKRLFGLSAGYCSFPGCEKKLVTTTDALSSNICHIEAALEGGERYNEEMTDKERADYDNLILLCPQHHSETNDVKRFPVSALKKMKADHEAEMFSRIDKNNIPRKYNSSLALLVNKLSLMKLEESQALPESLNAINPEDKINHNNVTRYQSIFKELKVYSNNLDKVYAVFEDEGSYKKEKMLRNIKLIYLKAKGEILGKADDLDSLRKNADDIIDRVKTILWENYDQSFNNDLELPYDDIEFFLNIIIVDSFIRCKILEEPVYDS